MRGVLSAGLLLCLGVSACSEPSGPESFGPRIVSLMAIACEGTTRTREQCVRDGFEIDPALGDSSFHFTLLIPVFQNPPADAWRLLTIWVNGDMTQTLPTRLGTIKPDTRTVTDTIVFQWLPPAHPRIEIEISMVAGEDPRFVRPIADTLLVWQGTARSEGFRRDTMFQSLVPGL